MIGNFSEIQYMLIWKLFIIDLISIHSSEKLGGYLFKENA